ncbi:DMT family transporter [Azospirillum brasilense]|uniref:DMT family transporter n=1 Tax=Azospirillum brasilense TaxID=192 RepID=A0A0P0F6M7_AZOBR|nr:DMT family transporter [Azospirillum brasilense]PWC91623.1 multidrug DMT transporter permease [Azospirillum sp. Sp 7]ALJ38976.1 multidrug DMT transporter permease [Azospirillum brasilense]NUB14688.1 EamA family transporter [Azospirillum brasilense]NUB29157.1 EamA family transporter [Azospirillum brasilense]NUB35144.1 EamA family transporter [Azospirillum brasilense]
MPDCSRPPEGVSAAQTVPSHGSERRDDPVRGILMVVAAVFFFSCSDATAKYLSQTLPSIEIGWMRYVGFTTLLLPLMIRGGPPVMKTASPGLQVLRALGMLGSALFFIMGMRYLPLAEAAATSYVSPVFVTVLSILVLGEKIGPRRWAAVLVGLLGVLIVIRPGGAAFQPAAIFPILSAMSWATGVVITRKMTGQEHPTTTLIWTALTGLAVLTVLLPFNVAMPTATEVALGALIGLVSTMGQWLMVQAYRFGEASVLAPCSYVQIVWSTLLGFLIFGALPDHWTFLGAGIIIASGLYTAHRERLRKKQQQNAAAPAP